MEVTARLGTMSRFWAARVGPRHDPTQHNRLKTFALVLSRETGFRRHASRSVPELGFAVFPSGSLTEGERPAGKRLVEDYGTRAQPVQRCVAGFLSFPMLCGSPGSVKALQEQPVAPTRYVPQERAHTVTKRSAPMPCNGTIRSLFHPAIQRLRKALSPSHRRFARLCDLHDGS